MNGPAAGAGAAPAGVSLVDAAREAARRAYAPYSNFHVGAAVRTEDGRIFAAPNIENASYGLSLCAETNAIMAAVAAGARALTEIAVIGYPAHAAETADLAMPCGRCRQIMTEFAAPTTPVRLIPADGGAITTLTVADLLPHAFGPAALKR